MSRTDSSGQDGLWEAVEGYADLLDQMDDGGRIVWRSGLEAPFSDLRIGLRNLLAEHPATSTEVADAIEPFLISNIRRNPTGHVKHTPNRGALGTSARGFLSEVDEWAAALTANAKAEVDDLRARLAKVEFWAFEWERAEEPSARGFGKILRRTLNGEFEAFPRAALANPDAEQEGR